MESINGALRAEYTKMPGRRDRKNGMNHSDEAAGVHATWHKRVDLVTESKNRGQNTITVCCTFGQDRRYS
jgi:hypothetical protein